MLGKPKRAAYRAVCLGMIFLTLWRETPAFAADPSSGEEQERKELFLKAWKKVEPRKATPTPAPRPRPVPMRIPIATPKPSPKPTAAPSTPVPSTPAPTPEETPRPTPKETTKPKRVPEPTPEATPRPTRTPAPTAKPAPIAQPAPPPKTAAPIVISKYGLEEDEGVVEPEPTPKRRGFRFFGSSGGSTKRYKYLTSAIREEIDKPKVMKNRWKYIIVHNSGTKSGNAKAFDYYHKKVRKMQNGLAYHFVIGNGTSSGDGQIEIGNRWKRQINGGHVASDYLNNIAIGICFVGDFNRTGPTEAQLQSLEELIEYLRKRVGKIKGAQSIVKAHKQINPKPTDCPGDRFPYDWLRRKFQ
jgi:hypothetical protein